MIENISFFSKDNRLPIIQQSESSECGLACIAMIACFFGYRTNLTALRAQFNTSLHGMTLQTLGKIARRLNLNSRSLKVDIEEISNLQLPAILHWDLNHFVVLKSISKTYAVIHDPKNGRKKLNWEDFSKHYTGIAVELTPTKQFVEQKKTATLKITDLWSNISGLKRGVVQLLLLTLLVQISAIFSPLFLQVVVDDVLSQYNTSLLIILTISFSGLALLDAFTTLLRQYVNIFIGNTLSFHIASNIFQHLLNLPIDFFEKRKMGDINSRFSSIEPVRDMIAEKLVVGFLDSLLVTTTFTMMLVVSPILALVSLLSLLGFLVLRLTLFAALKRKTEDALISKAGESSEFMESVRSIISIRLFGAETDRHQKWQNKYADSINANISVQKYEAWYSVSQTLLSTIEWIIIIYLSAIMVINKEFTIGMIFAFQAYRMNFVGKSQALVRLLIEFRMLRLHLDRIADIVHTTSESPRGFQSFEDHSTSEITGKITIKDLSYRYSFDSPKIINNLSIDIKAGESIAIVGATGCGKTTLLKLMAGLLSPQEGEILIDDRLLSVANAHTYRKSIGVVMQDDELLSGTIAENIAFFDQAINMERVVECAHKACIFKDIASLPMGFQSLIGEMGTALSGGQKQRISIARALYRQPRILFMDEGTSNLDVGTESQVNASIACMGISRIIIAHRPETIRSANHVYLLKNGKLSKVDNSISLTEHNAENSTLVTSSSKSRENISLSQDKEVGA